MKNSALIKWLDESHKQEDFMQEMGFDEDGDCEINKMHIEVLKRMVEDNEWISVADEKPSEEYENLLVKLDGRIITGAYFINDEFIPTAVVAVDKTNDVLDVKVDFTMKVTHWQNLS